MLGFQGLYSFAFLRRENVACASASRPTDSFGVLRRFGIVHEQTVILTKSRSPAAGRTETIPAPGDSPAVPVVPRDCPLCGDDNRNTPASRYSRDIWDVKTCRACGFTYITSAPDYSALFETLSWEKTSKAESQRRQATRPRQQSFSKGTRWRLHLLPRRKIPDLLARYAPPGNVIDLGCSNGTQFDGLAERFVPHGIEISKAAAAEADDRFRPRGGAAVNAACLEGLRLFPDRYFSAATLRSYLEHEMKPAEVLAELNRVLRLGGIALVKVPNYATLNRRLMGLRWCGFRHPDHLNYFTPATLRIMAANNGFSIRTGLTWQLPTSDNMWAILTKSRERAST